VIVRKDQHPGMQGFFYTFPELQEFSNRDLYKRHPTLPDHWIYYGRADSVIVFSNGEKLNPVTIEETIQDHPWVSGALVVGSERIQPALLLEPFKTLTSDTEKSNFIEEIWPLVVKANQETVAHGRISRELVTVSSPDKPFTRSGKGTVQRGATTKLFAAEIDLLYENAEQASFPRAFPLDFSSEDTLTETIVKNLDGLMLNQALDVNTNFFAMGMDSLQVINLSRLLRASLKSLDYDAQATQIVPRVIYNHPTASRLALYILSLIRNEGDMNGKVEDQESGEIQAMKTLYVRYTKDFSRGRSNRPDSCHTDQTILLTGSTGTLGSYILDQLIKEPAVRKVICLNRASDGGAKQQAEAVEQRGLKPDYLSKAEFHQFDVSQPDLGVSEPIYTQILAEVDRIIHNAWLVNYNLTTETFAPHLQGVRSIADIAANSQKRASVIFISSIATADKWDTSKGPVKEDRLENWTLPSNGYGRSKMVGSLILNEASKIGEFPAAIIRVGQIAGPEAQKGVWSKQEWLPSIIASSLHLGVLPRQLGVANRVDWMPVERTAKLILDIAFATELSGYFHAVNPYATSWEELVPAIQRFYGDRIQRLVGFEDWVEILESSQNRAFDSKVMDSNPGLKLLDSYRGMCGTELSKPVVFDVQRTMGISSTLRNMKGITSEMMEHWCRQWDF
jgi:thioester reductase-like protein